MGVGVDVDVGVVVIGDGDGDEGDVTGASTGGRAAHRAGSPARYAAVLAATSGGTSRALPLPRARLPSVRK